MSRKRNFCFTLNNYTDEEYNSICNFPKEYKYLIIGKEIGEQLTPHLQGFIMFNTLKSFTQVKSLFNNQRIHIEECKGSPIQNFEYCSKDGNFQEFGERPKGSGSRSDLDIVCDAIRSGTPLNDIICDNPGTAIKYYKNIKSVYNHINYKERNWKTKVYWVYGATGTGKSRWIHSLTDGSNRYSKSPENKWWDDYNGEDVILMDEFRAFKEMGFSYLLRLFDRYPMRVESKGASTQFLGKVIFITSPICIREAFAHLDFIKEGDFEQMMRRVEEINFNDNNILIRYLSLTLNNLI